MTSLARLLRHLFAPSATGLFPADRLQRIAEAVAEGERRHRGEVCFAVEPALPAWRALRGLSARERAHEVFAELGVWDTQANNGVLVYLLLADHRVTDGQWRDACRLMEERLRAGEPEAAAVAGVEAVSGLLARHFPQGDGDIDENELPDLPRLL
jgi:uncharacterized membrane protein